MAEDKKAVEPEIVASKEDIDKNKLNAVLSYLGIFILVPLLSEEAKKSPFAQFHLNQGLVLLIAGVVGNVFFWIPLFGWAAAVGLFVIWLMGLIGALQGEMRRVPLLGNFELIKMPK
jgi:uncharacterized membrane protein